MKRVLLLFGSSGDLGRSSAEYFLEQNYDSFYFFARNLTDIGSGRKNVYEIQAGDLADESVVVETFSKIEKDKNAEYFLFSAIGGYAGGKPISETSYAEFKRMLEINLNISFLLAKHFTILVSGSAGGSICFTSAMSSFGNEINKAAYGISKNALNYLVATLASEGKSFNLSANAVAPFIIDTPENRKWVTDIGEMVTPAEIAAAAEDMFRSYRVISGNILKLNGKR